MMLIVEGGGAESVTLLPVPFNGNEPEALAAAVPPAALIHSVADADGLTIKTYCDGNEGPDDPEVGKLTAPADVPIVPEQLFSAPAANADPDHKIRIANQSAVSLLTREPSFPA